MMYHGMLKQRRISRCWILATPGLLFTLAILVTLAGCAGRQPSGFEGLSPKDARALAASRAAARQRELEADLAAAFSTHAPANILVLSGGDANGAFGCGFLAGWRDSPGGRPAFDVVTGVSTGALMATSAFLGEKADDDLLAQVYTNCHTGDIYQFTLFDSRPAVFTTTPLQHLIERVITPQTIERVAQAHRHGRRLYVATVALDEGSLIIWPMSKLAAEQGIAGIDRYRQILLAAAAIPVLFPPVAIDNDLQVDAGLREELFLRQAMLGIGRAFDSAASAPSTRPTPPTVFVIFNGKLHDLPRPTDYNLVGVGVRSLQLYSSSLEYFNIRNVAMLAMNHQPPFRFCYTAVPDDYEEDKIGNHQGPPPFDPETMQRLYAYAQRLAGDPQTRWHEELPPLDADPQ